MKILGIETSCDETAAAMLQVPSTKFQATNKFQILSNIVASQAAIHQKYGGIVPEVAARKHIETIIPVIQGALSPQFQRPDLIAVTQGPGLITALQVGVQTAKTLAYVWNIPLVGVNHLEAHLWSHLLNQDTRYKIQETILPAIGLVISGGHTEMVLVKGVGRYQLIGRTRDDAVGEAFDKVAKLLGLGYPGGPIISHFAQEGDPDKIIFPRPMLKSPDFDFSFSGVKTAVKYHLKNLIPVGNLSQAMINDVCAGFQQAVVDVLVSKTVIAAEKYRAKSVILGGGVSANQPLIKELSKRTKDSALEFFYPAPEFTGDNAAMVALAGFLNQKKAQPGNWQKLAAQANWSLA